MDSAQNKTTAAAQTTVHIRLQFKSNRELLVARSFLMESSSYFATMLTLPAWRESQTGVIQLPQWRRRVFFTIMSCLESGDLGPVLDNIEKFYGAIDYFLIEPLLKACVDAKIASISDKSVTEDYAFAQRYAIAELRDAAVRHLLGHLPEFLEDDHSNLKMQEDLLVAVLNNPRLAIPDEDTVLRCIDRWCSLKGREAQRPELLHTVRFAHLTARAFKKCLKDPQCWQVPQFRELVENSSWGELDGSVLSGRAYSRGHVHAMGRIFCEGSVDSNELWGYLDQIGEYRQYCSRSGMKKLPQIGRSRSRYSAVTNPSGAVMVGNELYVGHGPSHRVQVSGTFLTSTIEEFRLYQPTQGRNEYLRFPGPIFFAAPPATDDGDVCIAHLVYGGQAIDNGDAWQSLDVDASEFAGLQLLRYHNGQRYGTSKRVRVDVEAESWRKTCLALLDEKANKLCVKGEWAMLLVPELGVLVALDKEPEGGPIIDLPLKNFDCSGLLLSSVRNSSNIAISGNMAYVILVYDIRSSEFNDEGDFVSTRHPMAALISCDLVKGEYVDCIDADEVFAASKMTDDQEYELHLKVVQGNIYLYGTSTHVLRTEGDVLSPCSFVYRVETSDGRLSLTRQVSDLDGFGDVTHKPAFRWIGGRVPVDLSPCEHASMLHLQAGREEDPMLCERLRQYTW